MRFAHLADLHIGRRFGDYSMADEQSFALNAVLESLSSLKPEAVFIAGDVYDKTIPSEDAVSLADDFFTGLLDIAPSVIVIPGNHDSQARLSFASRITSERGFYVARGFSGTLEKVNAGGADVWLMPHVRPREVSRFLPSPASSAQEAIEEIIKPIPYSDRSIILSHQFVTCQAGVEKCDSEIEAVGGLNAVDAGVFDGFKYAALGHLHKPQRVGRDGVRYAGSLLKYSFSEANHNKSFVFGEMSDAGLNTRLIPIPSLRGARVITGTLEELLANEENAEDYVSAVLTDEVLPIAPAARLGCVYSRLVNVGWLSPGKSDDAAQALSQGESPRGILTEFFRGMNARDMSAGEKAYISELWRSVGEELGK